MLKIKNLKMKNFLSVGNAGQEINFNRNELVLIIGYNGAGKTLVFNCLSYALFAWPLSNIKKEHLINITNGKNMLVTIEFEVNNKEYKIVRGLKPRILEFYENGIKKDESDKIEIEDSAQGDNRETQKEIDRVLGMSHDMFCQIVALNTYTTPFLSQKINDQREIIEQLLGITLLSEKAEKLKEDIRLTKEEASKEDVRLKNIQAANKRIQDQINILITRSKDWNNKRNLELADLYKQIDFLSNIDIDVELANHAAWSEYDKQTKIVSDLNSKKKQVNSTLEKEKKNLSKLLKDLDSLNNQTCHTCHQKLHDEIHAELRSKNGQDIQQIEASIIDLDKNILIIENELKSIRNLNTPPPKIYKTLPEVYDHRNKLNLVIHQREQKELSIDPYADQIVEMKNTAIEEVDMGTINELTSFIEHQEFLLKLLTNKDSFLRRKIIEQNISFLNSRLQYYLYELGLSHNVKFQTDLGVEITEFGRELSVGNLSRGETARLSIGLSFAFRDVYETLYQPINLLCLDEILDSGVDVNGSESAMKLLRDMCRDRNRDIWVITHREELTSKSSSVLLAKKFNGYTTFEFEKPS